MQKMNSKQLAWWKKAQFGIFIHWGLYSLLAGQYKGKKPAPNSEGYRYAEWIMASAGIPLKEYQKLAKQFNPVKFNAKEWVDLIRASGAKYLVITSKHHEGFSMYDSQVSDYTIVKSTPFGKDPIDALAKECKKSGIGFGLYYAILDWGHPAFMTDKRRKTSEERHFFGLLRKNRKQEYVKYMKDQIKELIARYDPAILWLDGEWVEWWTKADGKKLERYIYKLNPKILINNRVGKRQPSDGDFGTPEQEVPLDKLSYPWESCMTINGTWGYSKYDKDWKSAKELHKTLLDVKKKGGNFLLNIGPTDKGVIPAESVKRLLQLGKLLKS